MPQHKAKIILCKCTSTVLRIMEMACIRRASIPLMLLQHQVHRANSAQGIEFYCRIATSLEKLEIGIRVPCQMAVMKFLDYPFDDALIYEKVEVLGGLRLKPWHGALSASTGLTWRCGDLQAVGGPSGSGKTSLAHKMANIVGCEVISLESYYKTDQVKDFKYDDFSSLDLSLLLKNIEDIRARRTTRIPLFDFEKSFRSGFKDLEVSEDCGVASNMQSFCGGIMSDIFYSSLLFFKSLHFNFVACLLELSGSSCMALINLEFVSVLEVLS
eukprot:Gb_02092 [translate_table: standard]